MPESSVRSSEEPGSERIREELGLLRDPRNPFHQMLERLLDAAEMAGLRPHHRAMLGQPKSEIMVHFPVLMDDGRHRIYKGYRVQHNNALGPFKGGLRFHPRLSLDETKALAILTTLRCALLRLPFGGAMGGVKCNPRELSDGELMRLTRRFAAAISHYVGPDYDVVEPDIGTDARVMGWFADTLVATTPELTRQVMFRAVTGKPIELGGSFGRDRAVGQGVVHALVEMLPEMEVQFAGGRFVAVGFGVVGSWAARCLAERGMTLVGVLDEGGAIAAERGIDPHALAEHVQRTGGIEGFAAATPLAERDLWAMPCDLLVVAAADGIVDVDRAQRIAARVVVEGGHLPATPEAIDVLVARGIEILPSVLCAAGGVVASYFEWVQNRLSTTWSGEEVDRELSRAMTLAARRVKLARIRYECDWREAALCAALERLDRVYDLRGTFP
jgi:glutamate dehydrogenase (NAD(P)+)